DSRPELDRLMADGYKRRFDTVVVWKFDRFARSVSHLLRALETFKALGNRILLILGTDGYEYADRQDDLHRAWRCRRTGAEPYCRARASRSSQCSSQGEEARKAESSCFRSRSEGVAPAGPHNGSNRGTIGGFSRYRVPE